MDKIYRFVVTNSAISRVVSRSSKTYRHLKEARRSTVNNCKINYTKKIEETLFFVEKERKMKSEENSMKWVTNRKEHTRIYKK